MRRLLDPERLTKPIKERLDTEGFAIPKPSPSEPQQPKDGRRIESPREYRLTKKQMWLRQNRSCAKCEKFLPSPAFAQRHHPGGRGIGGGKRNDLETILFCIPCHKAEHPGPQWTPYSR